MFSKNVHIFTSFNDYFAINPLPANTELIVFNRLGKIIYSNNNYQNDWNGTENGNNIRFGNYWYVVSIPNFPTKFKGFVLVKK